MLPSSPHKCLLPGRTAWLHVCHADPAPCSRCREAIARFLAEEIGWKLKAALDRPAESYAAEFHPGRCTLEEARELRRLTVEECWWAALSVTELQPIVADFDFGGDFAEVAAA